MRKDTRLYNVFRNIQYGLISQALAIIFSFINRTLFIKVLGTNYLGINGLFTDVLTMLSLADLGLSTAMVYSFYKPLAEKNYEKLSSLTFFYKKIYEYIAVIVIVIGIALIPFLKYIVNLDSNIPYLKVYYLLFVFNTAASYLYIYKSSIISADQKNYIISIYQSISKMIILLLQCVILIIFKRYFLYLILQIVGTLLNNILVSRKADKLYPRIIKNGPRLNSNEKKDIFENIKSVFLYKASSVLLNGTDNTILSILVGTVWVGLYSNYTMVINGLNSVTSIIFNSTVASIGNIVVTESEKKRREVFNKIQLLSLTITTITTVCLYILFNDFIGVWVGRKYILNNIILLSIITNYYLAGVLQPIWIYRQATGIYKQTKYIMLICAIVNIVLSVFMGIHWGMAGIFFASALSRLLTYFWYEPKVLFESYLGRRGEKVFFIQILFNIILVIISTYIINMFVGAIVVNDFKTLVLKGIVVGIFSSLISLIVYGRKLLKFR
ncbi:lipopolysaccharide biosynthesis protein [Ligilactobacillus agilis]|uniref:lipopolysaccharide biosynthesis protein n=1 Tax=Ligilactobacillus agilis TaxID=1601 RepID=UPI0019594313|nr:transporter [Ligilactobacillus agilis]MBM6763558.1 transporter [Ligilactobacillus agilis]